MSAKIISLPDNTEKTTPNMAVCDGCGRSFTASSLSYEGGRKLCKDCRKPSMYNTKLIAIPKAFRDGLPVHNG